ncbi:hypothetical protein TSUD_400340 [Trifolium subterraneum]|uniref:SWIM-type domain-containing protein n=1 Tax=Trifolium subterraneum TaxID=3900 RepID=A0A2Z6P917_TRISU|nr:hypothetical protein TSUD_400340 [Trifolium subterraneum]
MEKKKDLYPLALPSSSMGKGHRSPMVGKELLTCFCRNTSVQSPCSRVASSVRSPCSRVASSASDCVTVLKRRMEANRQSENDVGFEDLVGDEQIDSLFDNEEYNSSDGEIGGRIDEEMSDNEEGSKSEGELELSSTDNSEEEECDAEPININCMADIMKIDMNNISVDEVGRYSFSDLAIAYKFYYWYGRTTRFSVCKSRYVRNVAGEIVQKTFLCSRKAYRESNALTPEKRKREPKNEIDGTMCGMLPAHRKLTEKDVQDIESHGNVGIRPYQMYGAMANSAGGFHKQDQLMFFEHKVDNKNRLERLFWYDGESRKNFEVFGDVLAFDATYRKNKYNCPFVVFSGVNHHNQTIVFATGLVTRETEETYVWLLEQFACAMQGKTPISVITNGDIAMKNAIRKVFPKAHHRLCVWRLLRNASTNVGIPDFMRYLKRCMLGDIEINKFEELWGDMLEKFGLEDNMWIKEMYAKRKMWSTAYIRGFFFAGLRTTSRCEALHSHLRQFVHSRISLFNFVQQFQRCLTYFRFREIEADFRSNYGQPVMQSSLHSIERSAASQYTKEIFNMFKVVLSKCMLLKVLEVQQMSSCCIYKVAKYCGNGDAWYVTHSTYAEEKFKCSCLRMESIGLPCDHIVCVLVYLDIDELPKCLDSQVAARYSSLVKMSKDVAELVYDDLDDYNRVVDVLHTELKRLKAKQHGK